jgi:hypothetical protein
VAAYNGWLLRPPLTPATQRGEEPTLLEPLEWFDLEPRSADPQYLTEFDHFAEKRDKQKDLLIKASSTIRSALDPAIGHQYDDDKYLRNPGQLREDIKAQYQRQVRREGAHLLTVPTTASRRIIPLLLNGFPHRIRLPEVPQSAA